MKSVAVITSTRADYGLLRPVLKQLFKRSEIKVDLIVTGSHLCDGTIDEIIEDGFSFHSIDIMKYPRDNIGVAKITVLTQQLFIDKFESSMPDGVLLLGDRYEIFAVAVAARFLDIPIFHISGGDVTSGAIDDSLRHCITKLASVHFPSCERYAQRLKALGEQPSSIYNVGGLGDENIRNINLMDVTTLSKSLDFDLDRPFLLVTYHPETLSKTPVKEQVEQLTKALSKYNGALVITGSNSDAGADKINSVMIDYCSESSDRLYIKSMGLLRYLSAMKIATAVVGNSSSGVCETPTFGTPTVNIGNRQNGRLISENILCCDNDSASISTAITRVISDEFAKKCALSASPYHGENTSENIASITARLINSGIKSEKEFYDIQ